MKVGNEYWQINVANEQFTGMGQETFDNALRLAKRIAYLYKCKVIVTIQSKANRKTTNNDNTRNQL